MLSGCALAAGLSSCASRSTPARVASTSADAGWVDPSTSSPRAAPPRASAPLERWDLDAQLKTLRPVVKRAAASGHLTGELEADVLAGSAGTYPVLGPESRVPPGATLVERLFEPGGASPVAYFVMVKRPPGFDPGGNDWEYLVVTPGGSIEQRGPLPLCARCHAEAPHDRLFGAAR
ncbi:hypothetical protein A7982_12785 [Minicystis rosea]|nr:hypothetical protein A7982_12785 [Minicystis rosea]